MRVVKLHRLEFMGIGLSSTTLTKEEERKRRRKRMDNDGGGLNRPGDWAYLDEQEMSLVENAIRQAQQGKEQGEKK